MLAPANAASPRADHAAGPQQETARSIEGHRDVSSNENELERLRLGLDTLRTYNHRGIIIVASVWLAFYVIMSIGHLMAPTN
jgi:hypothetical protein